MNLGTWDMHLTEFIQQVQLPDPYGVTNPYWIDFTHTEPGMQRGNPDNDDSYMFVTLSAYKKLDNAAKSYRTINIHQKRKIKAFLMVINTLHINHSCCIIPQKDYIKRNPE